jgi:hypothetical protein
MNNPKMDFGESRWSKMNPDAFGKEPFVAAPDPIQPRPSGWMQHQEVRSDTEMLQQAMATYAEIKATAETEIRNLERQIRVWRERVQIARDRLSSIQGC